MKIESEHLPKDSFTRKLFGFVNGDALPNGDAQHIGGLFEAKDKEEFDSLLLAYTFKWKGVQGAEQVVQWVRDRSEMFKTNMLVSVCTKCGLGFPPIQYITNDSEINNKRIQNKMNHQESGITAFVKGVSSLMKNSLFGL